MFHILLFMVSCSLFQTFKEQIKDRKETVQLLLSLKSHISTFQQYKLLTAFKSEYLSKRKNFIAKVRAEVISLLAIDFNVLNVDVHFNFRYV